MHKLYPVEERLLVLLNLAKPGAAQTAEIKSLGGTASLDWEKLFVLSELNAVTPLTLVNLAAAGLLENLPAELLERWEAKAAPIRERNAKRVVWATQVLEALHEAGIEVIVLKGSMFADEIYRDRSYKKMNDVDVMIRREDAEETIDVLKSLGFQGVGALFGKSEISASSHHTPPYVSADLACVIGLHWGLVSPLSPWRPDTLGIWKRKVAIRVADAPAFRMSWEDNLLHLCIHLPFFKTGLRELADVYNLVLHTQMDWDHVARLAHRWRAEDAVYRVLALADALVELGIPGKYWRNWSVRSSGFTLKDTEKRLLDTAELLRSRSTQAAKIEKAFAVFTLSENYAERAKAWAGMYALLLWPKESELVKLAAERELASHRGRWLRARLRAPMQLWNAMARDHGHLPLAAMTVVNAGVIARATARAALSRITQKGKPGRSLRDHPAVRLLEVLE